MPQVEPKKEKPIIDPSCFMKPCFRVDFSVMNFDNGDGKTRENRVLFIAAGSKIEALELLASVCKTEEQLQINGTSSIGECLYKIEWASVILGPEDNG